VRGFWWFGLDGRGLTSAPTGEAGLAFGVAAGGELARIPPRKMMPIRNPRLLMMIGAALLLSTVILYWPTRHFEFINLDDPTYVLQNPKVSQGVTGAGIQWAFTAYHGANWHPLTWISHMVDVSLFGFKPAGHHLVNVGWHAVNALLLFLFLRQATGAVWRSALVAALFAWHPTHVESVAWVSERKDVLSTFFGLLCLLAYTRFAQGKIKNEKLKSVWYGLALLCFALGLMSKPMLVTWPFVLLLLDIWPLRRLELSTFNFQLSTLKRLVLEKLPFFVLTIASCVLTFFAQRAGGAVQSMEHLPLAARVANAVVAYARYLGKTFWPAELSAYYPHPLHWPDAVVGGSVLLLLVLLGIALWNFKQHGYLFVGLSWFWGTLVPVIGLVQVGGQSIADRYLYIPQIGILVATVWGGAALVAARPQWRQVAVGLCGVALLGCLVMTSRYLPHWKNSTSVFQQALRVDPKNPPALYSLGLALCEQGKYAEATPYLVQAAELAPYVQVYQGQLAQALEMQGDSAGAIARYRRCIELEPGLTEALNNLAWILATHPDAQLRNGAEAVQRATRACELTDYDWPLYLGTLAASYAEAGRFGEAIATAERAEQKARARGFNELADRNVELLQKYRAGQPHREAVTP
jgi:tetratricopeptide (TPR) repeat protein